MYIILPKPSSCGKRWKGYIYIYVAISCVPFWIALFFISCDISRRKQNFSLFPPVSKSRSYSLFLLKKVCFLSPEWWRVIEMSRLGGWVVSVISVQSIIRGGVTTSDYNRETDCCITMTCCHLTPVTDSQWRDIGQPQGWKASNKAVTSYTT